MNDLRALPWKNYKCETHNFRPQPLSSPRRRKTWPWPVIYCAKLLRYSKHSYLCFVSDSATQCMRTRYCGIAPGDGRNVRLRAATDTIPIQLSIPLKPGARRRRCFGPLANAHSSCLQTNVDLLMILCEAMTCYHLCSPELSYCASGAAYPFCFCPCVT